MEKNSQLYKEKVNYKNTIIRRGKEEMKIETWEEYLTFMGQGQLCGTPLEARTLAFCLARPIVLLEFGHKPIIYNVESKEDPLFLHHLGENLFESCVPFKALEIKDVYAILKRKFLESGPS